MWLVLIALVVVVVILYHWKYKSWTHFSFTLFFLTCIPLVHGTFWKRLVRAQKAPLPETGPAILIANHTCSADPLFLYPGVSRLLSFLVTARHYNVHPLVKWVLDFQKCIAVRVSGPDVKAAMQGLQRLKEGRVVALFPEAGLTGVLTQKPRRARHGAAYLALKSGAPIFPAYISGGPQTDQLLPSWLVRSTMQAHVYFGPEVDLSAYRGKPITKRVLEEVSCLLMNKIWELQPPSEPPKKPFTIPKEVNMATDLTSKKCVPCEGGVPTLTADEVSTFLKDVNGWEVIDDGKAIRRKWQMKNFVQCLDFCNKVGELAEAEGHHPDLHLTGYRNVAIEISTHAIGGLSENDFILAAKIDRVSP